MHHQPVHSAAEGQALQIKVTFTPPPMRVYQVRVYYRNADQTAYRFQPLTPQENEWIALIPGDEVRGPRLQYFISAAVENDLVLTFPAFNPYNRPEDILITAPAEKPAPRVAEKPPVPPVESKPTEQPEPQAAPLPEITLQPTQPDTMPSQQPMTNGAAAVDAGEPSSPILILSPNDAETLAPDQVAIAVSLISGEEEIEQGSVRLWLDGAEITTLAESSPSLITYTPKQLKPGPHKLTVQAKSAGGSPLPQASVRFLVESGATAKAEEKALQVHLFADGRTEQMLDDNQSLLIGGADFTGAYKSLFYEGNLYLTSLEDRNRQPANRFYLNLHNKWFGVAAGDIHPMYNDLILWGRRVRGFSGYLHLGFLNIDLVSGSLTRAVNGNRSADSTRRSYGTFQQNLIGIRPSIGSGKNFQLGLTLVKVKDDTQSIRYGAMPKDNLVVGPDLKLSFDRGRIQVEARGALSLLTEDISPGAVTADDLEKALNLEEDLPIDPESLADYFIVNESTQPLNPLEKTSMAYNAAVKLDYFRNLLQVGYKSIGASYRSLANSWLRTNLEGWYFNDRLRLFDNKVYATIGYEDLLDNFSRQNSNPSISLKTFNYSVTLYPGKDLPQLTLGMRDQRRDNGVKKVQTAYLYDGLETDTLVIDDRELQTYRDLSAQISQNLSLFDLQHTISLSYISTRNIDEYKNSRAAEDIGRELNTGVFMINVNTQFAAPLKTNLSFASNRNSGPLSAGNLDYLMFGGGAEYGLWQDRLTLLADLRRMQMTFAGPGDNGYGRTHFRLGATWQIAPRHTVAVDGNLINLSSDSVDSYTDKIFRIRYDRYF
ncbi:MAG TPA: hypothetical protein PK843_06935 [bacterium]|nr:hypothetical protein [bacterium]HPN34228.1 hypothetical protein [bacterium]